MDLVREFAVNNSDAAFATLVERHINLVYSAAMRRLGNPHEAEEVAQVVFIILAKKARSLRPGTVLSGWLYQTAQLTAANSLRTKLRRQRREQEAFMQFEQEFQSTEWSQLSAFLEDAMSHLREKERDAIVLRFFENRSIAEVAAALGLGEAAAQKRVSRATDKLRNFFASRGVHISANGMLTSIGSHAVQFAPAGLASSVASAALTKGAAASGSTLTLLKGALKVMAWTKTKTAIIAGAAALLAVGGGALIGSALNTARTTAALATMQGNWEGTWDVGPDKLRLVIRIFETNGVYRASMDSIDTGAKDVPIPKLSARSHSIHLEAPAVALDYQAILNSDGTVLTGRFRQLNSSSLLILKRTAAPDTATALSPEQYAQRPDSALQGAWVGRLKVGKNSLRLDLRIAETAPGTFQAEVDSPDQGAMHFPVTSMSYHAPLVEFNLAAMNGRFQGTLNDSADEFAGTWTQGRRKFPLTFDRVSANAAAGTKAEKDYGQGARDQIQGHWKGALRAGGVQLNVVFHIAQMPDGSYSATLDSPDQGATGIPATSVDWTFPNVRLTWKQFGAVYIGKLDNGRLTGAWHQGKAVLALQLQRTP